jgi:hypothetical protein
MDFDNLDTKIKRLFLLIDDTFIFDVVPNVDYKIKDRKDDLGRVVGGTVTISFGKNNNIEMQNKLLSIFDIIYSFKDILINYIQSKDVKNSKFLVEEYIKSSKFIKVAMDLSNMNKHGSILSNPWCKEKLKVINISQALTSVETEDERTKSFIFSEKTRNNKESGHSENSKIIMTGEIVDEFGKHIMSIYDLIKGSKLEVLDFINYNNLL